jgi:hypothetical protein
MLAYTPGYVESQSTPEGRGGVGIVEIPFLDPRYLPSSRSRDLQKVSLRYWTGRTVHT